MRWLVFLAAFLILPLTGFAYSNAKDQYSTAACTFQDGKQISVRYERAPVAKNERLPLGELWPKNSASMYLFTQGAVSVGNSEIPLGAFSIYFVPEKEHWTLVLNKNVKPDTPYDQQQDLLRVPMEIGQLGQPLEQVKIAFGHVAPKQCNMRIYYGAIASWAEFHEK